MNPNRYNAWNPMWEKNNMKKAKKLPESMVQSVTYDDDGNYDGFVASEGWKETKRPELIEEEASRVVRGGEREVVYGHPGEDFRRTAKMWSAILGVPVTSEQLALCMVALKISRLVSTPGHRDSLVDMIGYTICYDRVRERKQTPKSKEEYRKLIDEV